MVDIDAAKAMLQAGIDNRRVIELERLRDYMKRQERQAGLAASYEELRAREAELASTRRRVGEFAAVLPTLDAKVKNAEEKQRQAMVARARGTGTDAEVTAAKDALAAAVADRAERIEEFGFARDALPALVADVTAAKTAADNLLISSNFAAIDQMTTVASKATAELWEMIWACMYSAQLAKPGGRIDVDAVRAQILPDFSAADHARIMAKHAADLLPAYQKEAA